MKTRNRTAHNRTNPETGQTEFLSGGKKYTDWRQIPSPVSAIKAAYMDCNKVQQAHIVKFFQSLVNEK